MYILMVEVYEVACGGLSRGIIEEVRAGDGARTRDSLLGRQELYH
jgi:hypothetical protein